MLGKLSVSKNINTSMNLDRVNFKFIMKIYDLFSIGYGIILHIIKDIF
jgi:hypothetical protein